uniref:Uncharacterized protein n=1 Tax=Globodera pallida TaxID=36090 RepID=A0A183BQW7_GLOPA
MDLFLSIVLNFQRKSVIGLNFDFLLLNVIGFCCYTVYNVMLYFDQHVQQLYIERHGQRSLIPVLINDVVFATHALLACIITGLQCFVYERGTQRISYIGRSWASFLLCFSFVSLALALFHVLNWLDFINYLSYTKLAVTLSKYLPQAILNFKRKSTVCNMLFDILFITQHYVLYRAKSGRDGRERSNSPDPSGAVNRCPARMDPRKGEFPGQKVFVDELNQIRLVNPALIDSVAKLAAEGKEFIGQFEHFLGSVSDVREAMETIGRITDRERLKLLSLQNRQENQREEAEEMQQLKALVSERQKELERLNVELACLRAVEAQQNEYLTICKKIELRRL